MEEVTVPVPVPVGKRWSHDAKNTKGFSPGKRILGL